MLNTTGSAWIDAEFLDEALRDYLPENLGGLSLDVPFRELGRVEAGFKDTAHWLSDVLCIVLHSGGVHSGYLAGDPEDPADAEPVVYRLPADCRIVYASIRADMMCIRLVLVSFELPTLAPGREPERRRWARSGTFSEPFRGQLEL